MNAYYVNAPGYFLPAAQLDVMKNFQNSEQSGIKKIEKRFDPDH